LPPYYGCFLEPVACCLYAVRRGAIPSGGTVLVTGAGSNGLIIVQLARVLGAGTVVVSEPDAERRGLALSLGADEAFDPLTTSPAEALGGRDVEVAIETAGNPTALQNCLDAVVD